MGRGRAVVAAVLSVISLAVLSLHVALCLHYPSPLFAVTLLLNPSLWMLLGAVGMGCALALTYRERQRKVRAALCTTCHTRYGATVDGKWRESVASRPRGPSRAVYTYNGISHKFYASYGAISEKTGGGMKHPASLHRPPAPSAKQAALPTCMEKTRVKTPCEPEKDEVCGEAQPVTGVTEVPSPENSSIADPPSAPNTDSTAVSVISESPATTSLTSHSDAVKRNPQTAVPEEKKLACNCHSRYGGMIHRPRERGHHRAPGDGGAPRRRPAQPEVRTVGKYNKRILMQCRARDPKDVPVHLFTAASVSANQDTESAATTASPAIALTVSCSGSRPIPPCGLASATNPSREERNIPRDKETPPDSGCEPPEAQDSHSPADTRAPSHTPAPRPPSPASPSHPSPSPPPTPSATGINSGDSTHDDSQSLQDPEVASMSSECGLLPSSEESSVPLRSPLWGPLGGVRRERRSEERQAAYSGGRPPLSSLLATTRRVLARPRWTRQEERTPPALQLSPSSPRKRRVPGSIQGGRLWRQRKPSPGRTGTLPGAEGAEPLEGVGSSGFGATQSEAPDPVSPNTPARPRERKIRRTRPRPRPREAAGDSVLLLSDDATEE